MIRLTDEQYASLCDTRAYRPASIAAAYTARTRRTELTNGGVLFIVAADHTARGMVGVGNDPSAMADRRLMIDRLLTALENPRVDGVLASADIMDDLVLLGALENRVAVGTMNRGGLAGTTWGLDDRFTAYDTAHMVAQRLDAGKMLLRIHDQEAGTLPTLHACAQAVQELADQQMMAMVEPIPYTTDVSGKHVWLHDDEQLIRAVGISAALGASSAYNWLKIQATAAIERVARVARSPCGRKGSRNRPFMVSWLVGRCCTRATVTWRLPLNVLPVWFGRRSERPQRERSSPPSGWKCGSWRA
jgi:hypothetical protein